MSLPDSKGPNVKLVNSTAKEAHEQQIVNSDEWAGALPLEAYLRREQMLIQQNLTKDGGLTSWALVHETDSGRTVLSSCETIKKRALVAKDGQVKDTICHGVCSVFCPHEYRGKGYAGRMIKELGEKLETWQTNEQEESLFSLLWSDIGKKFYTTNGWHPYPSSQISLHPSANTSTEIKLPSTHPLKAADLAELCAFDKHLMRKHATQQSEKGKTVVAIVPDVEHLQWHHAREDFVCKELYGKTPEIKGAIVGTEPGNRVWCVWTRMWYNSDPKDSKGNTLHILRLVVEDPQYDDYAAASEDKTAAAKGSAVSAAIAALFAAAQVEAHKWNMGEVDIWNPTSTTLAAGRVLDPSVEVTHREKDSIASLRWYGEGSEDPVTDIEWVGNEKYCWC